MIKFKDRQGNIVTKDASPNKSIHFLYNTVVGRMLMSRMIEPEFSNMLRRVLTSGASSLYIDVFVKKNKLQLKDYKPVKYKCFNDFFKREIKPEKRPICKDENLLVSPSDGRVSVYPITDRLIIPIKNSQYSVKALVRNHLIAEEFAGGYCIVVRLTVDDYHHYCYCDDGYKSDDVFIPGVLHTVSPLVMDRYSVYAENQRVYTVIDTKHFGRVVQVEVGALGVGRIVNLDNEGEVKRGDEKGYFEFGGSTIVLLVKKDSVIPDPDLIANTNEGYETIVKMGERIGCNEKYQG